MLRTAHDTDNSCCKNYTVQALVYKIKVDTVHVTYKTQVTTFRATFVNTSSTNE
jgi:hypothetical protein